MDDQMGAARFSTVGLIALLGASAPTAAADISGPVRVIDGDTLDVAGGRVRLLGVDAPEGKQSCTRDGVPWLCGQEAGKALREWIAGAPVSCIEQNRDRYGRSVSVCSMPDGSDVGEWLVSNGYAVAYRQYSKRYVQAERAAQDAKRGLWAGSFQMPWEWRRK